MAGQDDVLLACTIGDLPWLKRGLSRKLDPNSTDKEGLNGLHLAALNGKLQCMKYLLDNCSINVNQVASSSGSTALHYSISNKNSKSVQCLRLLLERGAKRDVQNKSGYSALHLAAKCGNVECLRALLESGADIHTVDLDNNTAYNIACLHNQHECARLLRALQWANEKDANLQETVQEEAVKQHQQTEMANLQTRLKKEAANEAYKSWLQSNNVATSEVQTPCACSQRKEAWSGSNRPASCATCSKMTSKHQSASQRLHPMKLAQPIKVSLEQADRNIGSVGKPDKLYPYVNHPPQHLRQHNSSGKETDIAEVPPNSTRTVSTPVTKKSSRQIPIGVKYYSKMQREHTMQQPISHPLANRSTADEKSFQDEDSDSEESNDDEEEDGDPNLQQLPFVFDHEDYNEDDIAFHDVGYENSLDALELPPALTQGKTPAEILQLLRGFGDQAGPRSSRRAQSVASGGSRNGFSKRIDHQRRFSLGAIPEGRMVTSYSDHEDGSQVLDEKLLASMISQYSESSITTEHQQSQSDCSSDEKVEETISLASPDVQEAPTLGRRKVSPPHSLKIVNLAWDDAVSDSVRSKLSPTPPAARPNTPTRTPPPAYITHKIHTKPTRRLTPPPLHYTPPHLHISPPDSKKNRKLTPPPQHYTPPHWLLHMSPPDSKPARKRTPPSQPLKPFPPNSAPPKKPASSNSPNRKITPPSLPQSPYVYSEDETSPPSSPSPPLTPRHSRSGSHSPLHDSTPPHSLFATSPLASKSMVLDSSDDNEAKSNGDASPKRRRSAPESLDGLQNKHLLKTTVFEYGGVLTHN